MKESIILKGADLVRKRDEAKNELKHIHEIFSKLPPNGTHSMRIELIFGTGALCKRISKKLGMELSTDVLKKLKLHYERIINEYETEIHNLTDESILEVPTKDAE